MARPGLPSIRPCAHQIEEVDPKRLDEGNVKEGDVRVDELEGEGLDDQRVLVIRSRPVVLPVVELPRQESVQVVHQHNKGGVEPTADAGPNRWGVIVPEGILVEVVDLNVRAEGGAGQPCLWWSQGCSIGCDYCLTDPKHPDNKGQIPTKPITGNDPHADKAGFRKSYCDAPKTKSVLPKEYWTLNIHAVEGAVNDSYKYNPWRAPGTAPVV